MGRLDRKKPDAIAVQAARPDVDVQVRREDEVLTRLQQQFGNRVAERILLGAPANGFELYLSDLLAAERATGEEFSAYIPGQAPQEWARFVQAWYRVLWSERDAVDGLGPMTPALEIDAAPDTVAPSPALQAALSEVDTAAPAAAPLAITADDVTGLALRKADGSALDFDDPEQLQDWFAALQARSTGGRALSDAEQAFLARVHGRTLPDARIHEGSTAVGAAADIQARAFTVGTDIWLGEPADLSTRRGARLLAHEATHVLQNQAGRGATAQTSVSMPGQPLELEADIAERTADRVWSERRAAWAFLPPGGLDSRAEYLAQWMLGRLPAEVGQAPDVLVREALRGLLAQRAQRRLAEAGLTLQAGLVTGDAGTDAAQQVAELAALGRATAAATAERGSLLFLLQLAGTPESSELTALQESFAPYPSFARQLHQALATLRGDDPLAHAAPEPASDTHATDTARGERTLALVRQLAPQLGLTAAQVDVHVGDAGAARARAAGTRGLAEDGAIYLDDQAFSPGTADARGLVAHELTHIAQEGLAPASGPDAALLAETEAAQAAWTAASGGSLSMPTFGLPTSHVAAEGGAGVDGAGVAARLTANREGVTANASSVANPAAGPGGGRDPNASEDSERKLEQYEDGVDGICELIEDLDAFDDLCDAIDDDEPTAGHLSRVMANEHAQRLPQMWQGALEGGEVAGQMQSAFNSEFDGRGFWEETELAFAMICRTAKAQARPEPETAGARQDAANAETAAAAAEREAGQSGEGGAEAGVAGPGADVAPVDPALAQFLGAPVSDVAEGIPAFDALRGVSDAQFQAITDATEHRAAFCESPPDIEAGRGSQVMEALFENLIGSGTAGFTDALVDGLVWDNVGKLGDLAVQGLTKGRLGTPFVGPIIQLAQNPPWTAEAWGFGESGPFTGLGEGYDNLGRTLDAFGSAESAGDYLGLFCAVLADVFGMLRDLIDGICTVLSTLSALCYVVGGILIIVGIALLWLAGIGAPLVSAGGWLTRMGGILGRINTVLGPVVILLSGLTTLFRTLAALMVPSDLYAQQLQGVGEDASNFGEKGGAKLGDMAAEKTNEALASAISPRNTDAGDTASDTGADGEALAGDIDTSNQAELDRVASDAQDALDADARLMGEDVPERTPEDGEQRTDDAPEPAPDADAPPRGRLRSLVDRIPVVNTAVQGVQDGWNDAKQGFSDPARFAQEGLNPQLRAYVDGQMSERIQDLATKAADLQRQVDAINANPDGDMMQGAQLQADLNATNQKIVALHADVSRQRDLIQDIQNQERAALAQPDNAQALADAEAAEQRARDERDAKDRERRTAEDAVASAEAELRAQQAAATEHTESTAQAVTDRDAAQTQANDLTGRASQLDTQAADTERARTLMPLAADARTNADALRNDLVGRNTTVDIDGTARERKVTDVRVNADGSLSLQVEKTRGAANPQWVDAGDVRQDRFQNEVRAAETAESSAQTAQSDVDTLLRPYGGEDQDPADLRTQATTTREQAERERAAQAQAQESVDRLATTVPASPDDGPVEAARIRVQNAQGELETANEQLTAAQQLTATARNAAATTAQQDSVGRHQEHVQHHDGQERTARQAVASHLTDTSSGNAMGGVGSAYKDLGQALSSWALDLNGVMSSFPTEIATSAHVQAQQAGGASLGNVVENSAQTALDAAFDFGARETPAELNALGVTQASVEERRRNAVNALLECQAPVDYDTFRDHRATASTAYEAYIRSHAEALRAYRAEQIVGALAAGSGALAEQGQPILQASESMAAPLQQSVGDEAQRTAIISGADSDVPAADSGLAGIVIDLIAKIGDNADEMDEQPSPGGPESGQQAADGQNTARDEAANRTDQVETASQQNAEFLNEAVALQSAQQENVAGNVSALEARQQVELQIQNEIKLQKATHLAERERQRGIASENAAAFNEEYQQMETWRVDYEAKKATVESEFQ